MKEETHSACFYQVKEPLLKESAGEFENAVENPTVFVMFLFVLN